MRLESQVEDGLAMIGGLSTSVSLGYSSYVHHAMLRINNRGPEIQATTKMSIIIDKMVYLPRQERT